MGLITKYAFVFFVLGIWTVPILMNVDKRDYIFADASAMTYEEAYPITFYDIETDKQLSADDMTELLLYWDFKVLIGYDHENPDIQFFAIEKIGDKKLIRRTACQVGELFEQYPLILQEYPEVSGRGHVCKDVWGGSVGHASGYMLS